MTVSSAQDFQEQMRQQQLIGMHPASQSQQFHPMPAGGNYAPYVPQMPFQLANMQNNAQTKSTPVNMGKISLLGISFSLMLLGAFTFLGGFLLGVWVAGPKATQPMGTYIPQQQIPYTQAGPAYPQGSSAQQPYNFERNLEQHIGSATETTLRGMALQGIPNILTPISRAIQTDVAKQVGIKTEDLLKQQLETGPSYPQQQVPYPHGESYTPHPAGGPAQLPVVTPHTAEPAVPSHPVAQASEEGFTVQLGAFASPENANALASHLQSLSYLSQITEGKAPDGSKIYYVHSGFYKDYTTALNAASQFTAQNIPGAIIVRISPQHKSAS